ncbi:MAG: glycine-rich domain-containing protein [Acetobacteraceae bacterium]
MHRIDVPSASTSLPAPRAYGTPGYFQEGNPLTSVDATIVDEDWANAMQEELVAIVLAAGMSLDKTNRAQVLAAIRSLIAASHGLVAFWGTGNFTVPSGITAVDVELWGGGAGSFASYGTRRSGGGGAGAYVRRRITGLTPFQVIVVTIGGGGIAGTTTGPSWPSGGGTSSFGSYISATGGALNGLVTPTGSVDFGGIGGTPYNGDLNIIGSSGGAATATTTGMGGASAVGGSIGSGTTGLDGIFPGGGAAGAGFLSDGVTPCNGAAGAPGFCIVRW